MQGATGERLCWYPLAHLLQLKPDTPSLHRHCPVVWLHDLSRAPIGWHSHACGDGGLGKLKSNNKKIQRIIKKLKINYNYQNPEK